MTAAFATVVFLATMWLVGVLAATMIAESSGKILAALKGQSPLAMVPSSTPVAWKTSPRVRSMRPMRARPMLRDAA